MSDNKELTLKQAHPLTAKQEHFAKLICEGLTNSDAYRTAYDVNGDTANETIWAEASKIRANPLVATRVRQGLDQARLQDLDSIGRHIRRTLDAAERAVESGSDNVEAKLLDQLGKMHGAFRDTHVLVVENHMSDAELVDRLARGSPERLEAARKLLDTPSGFAECDIIDVTPEEQPD